MISRTLTLINKLGLHARAANALLDITVQFGCNISIRFDDKLADAKSIMSVMLLAAPVGSELTFTADGDDESEAIEAITDLINNRFGESE